MKRNKLLYVKMYTLIIIVIGCKQKSEIYLFESKNKYISMYLPKFWSKFNDNLLRFHETIYSFEIVNNTNNSHLFFKINNTKFDSPNLSPLVKVMNFKKKTIEHLRANCKTETISVIDSTGVLKYSFFEQNKFMKGLYLLKRNGYERKELEIFENDYNQSKSESVIEIVYSSIIW